MRKTVVLALILILLAEVLVPAINGLSSQVIHSRNSLNDAKVKATHKTQQTTMFGIQPTLAPTKYQ